MARPKPGQPPPRPAGPTPDPGPSPRPGPARKPVSDAERRFGKRLKAARLAAGYATQAAAAKALGVKQPLISQYEAGERIPPITRLIEIVAALGLNPRLLVPEWWPGKSRRKKSEGA
jgi:ribosome-binding protein aMBF1 (putative translation factor)